MFTKIDKAITAGVAAGVLVYSSLAASGGHVDTLIAFGAAIGAALFVGVATFAVPNKTA